MRVDRGGGQLWRGAQVPPGAQDIDIHTYPNTHSVFILNHELTLSIRNLHGLGRMADQIIAEGKGLVTLSDFIWKAEEVAQHIRRNSTLKNKRLGMVFSREESSAKS